MTREFIITKEFDRTWKELGLNDDDLGELEIYLCKNPDCGDTLEGTGGVKKFHGFWKVVAKVAEQELYIWI